MLEPGVKAEVSLISIADAPAAVAARKDDAFAADQGASPT
jgi:hypothetical protein